MKPRAWSNPPNPFAPTALEYLEEDHPRAAVHVWDDSTKGILATNDSPDIGFKLQREPVPGLHARLRVLLRAARRTSTSASARARTSTRRSW